MHIRLYMPTLYTYIFFLEQPLPRLGNYDRDQESAGHRLTRITNLAGFTLLPVIPMSAQVYAFTPDTNSNFNALDNLVEHRPGHASRLTSATPIDQLSAERPRFTTNQTHPIDDSTERGPSDDDLHTMFGVRSLEFAAVSGAEEPFRQDWSRLAAERNLSNGV